MIQWVQDRKWLPSIYLSAGSAILLGFTTFFLQGVVQAFVVVGFCLSLVFAKNYPWISLSIFSLVALCDITFGLHIIVSFVPALAMVAIISAYASRLQRWTTLSVILVLGIITACDLALAEGSELIVSGAVAAQPALVVALLGSLIAVAAGFTFFMLGRLAYTQVVHIGSANDAQVIAVKQRELNLELAEQNQRLEIARDITDLITQDISAVLAQAGGGLYASKVSPEAGSRALEGIELSAREAHAELRRLHDMLSKSDRVDSPPPGLNDLQKLIVDFRELGYIASLRNEGDAFELTQGAELSLYRIVFEAFENVRLHVPRGSTVTVELSWIEDGLQLLIKDNGVETQNKLGTDILQSSERGYSIDEDIRALVQPITGLGLTVMQERAELYGGRVEALHEPGVGFTVSAIFPMMRTLGGRQSREG